MSEHLLAAPLSIAPGALSRRLSPGREILILLAGIGLFVACLAPALKETGTPPAWDQSNHLRDSLVYNHILRHPTALSLPVFREILGGSEEHPLLTPSGYYPPLVPGVTALLYPLSGRSYETAMATQVLFLVLLVLGTCALGNRLIGSPAGLLAALMLLASPGIRLNAAEYMLDLPLAAMVVVSTCALLATSGFARTGPSLFFGLLAGAGMLAKWTFFFFLAVPVIFVLASGLAAGARESASIGRRSGNFLLALLAGVAVAGPYYLPILPILVRKTITHAGGAADGFTSPFSLDSALFHLQALPRKLLGWPLTIATAAGLLAFLFRRPSEGKTRLLLVSWAASLYAVFTFAVANKQSRYLLPWVPVLLLMSVGGLLALWRRAPSNASWMRMGAVAVAVLPVAGLGGGWRSEESGDWNIRPLVARLEQDLAERVGPSNGVARLGVIPDMRAVNGPTIAYYAARRDLPVSVVQLVNRMKRHAKVEVGLDPFDRGDFYETFDRYDYMVTKDGDNAVAPWEEVVPGMHAFFEARVEAFDRLASFREPDGSTLSLYRRRSP